MKQSLGHTHTGAWEIFQALFSYLPGFSQALSFREQPMAENSFTPAGRETGLVPTAPQAALRLEKLTKGQL